MYAAKEKVALVASIDPDAYSASTVVSPYVKVDQFARFLAYICAGDLASGATLDAKIVQATDASGTGAKDVTSKAITQMTEAGADSNKQAAIDIIPAEDLDINNGFAYIAISLTLGTAGGDVGAHLFGVEPVNGPAYYNDAASVKEIV